MHFRITHHHTETWSPLMKQTRHKLCHPDLQLSQGHRCYYQSGQWKQNLQIKTCIWCNWLIRHNTLSFLSSSIKQQSLLWSILPSYVWIKILLINSSQFCVVTMGQFTKLLSFHTYSLSSRSTINERIKLFFWNMKKIMLWKNPGVKRMNVSFNAIGKISFTNPWGTVNLLEFGIHYILAKISNASLLFFCYLQNISISF